MSGGWWSVVDGEEEVVVDARRSKSVGVFVVDLLRRVAFVGGCFFLLAMFM